MKCVVLKSVFKSLTSIIEFIIHYLPFVILISPRQ